MVALLCALAFQSSFAKVLDASGSGFTIRQEFLIAADRQQVYETAVTRVAQWWSSDHTFSGDAANLYIEPRVQGCFCETFDDNGGVVHMVVTFLNPNSMVRLTGGLGPLGLMGVSGNMTWEFEDTEEGTRLVLTYVVGGYSAAGLDSMAGPVDDVLAEQFARLKSLLETGEAAPQS